MTNADIVAMMNILVSAHGRGGQTALAGKILVSVSHLNNIIHGRCKPGRKVLEYFGFVASDSGRLYRIDEIVDTGEI